MCCAHWHSAHTLCSAHCAQCTLCSEISLSPLLLQWPTGIRGNITGSRSSGWNDKILRATRLHFDSFSLFPQNFPSTNLNPISSNYSYLKKSSKLNSDCRCEVTGLWLTQSLGIAKLAVDSYLDIFLGLQNMYTYSSSWILWLLVVLPASMASLASLASMASPSSLPQFDGPPVGGGRQEAPRARQRWHKIGRCSFFAQLLLSLTPAVANFPNLLSKWLHIGFHSFAWASLQFAKC